MQEQQTQVGFTARDASDSSTILRFNINLGIEAIPAQAAATGLRGLLDPVTGCAFVRQSIVYPFVDTVAPVPLAGALASRVGVLIFGTTTPGEYLVVEVPGLRDSFLQSTGPGAGLLINRDDPAVQAFVGALISGDWCSPFGFQLIGLEAAFLQIRP